MLTPCAGEGKTLESFFQSTKGIFTHRDVQQWVQQLYDERDAFQKSQQSM